MTMTMNMTMTTMMLAAPTTTTDELFHMPPWPQTREEGLRQRRRRMDLQSAGTALAPGAAGAAGDVLGYDYDDDGEDDDDDALDDDDDDLEDEEDDEEKRDFSDQWSAWG